MKSLFVLCISILLLGLAHLSSAQENVLHAHNADKMPCFQGCEEVEDYEERVRCGEGKLLEFIYKRLRYPAEARENNVQGMVVVQYVIAIDGYVEDIEIVRDIGDGCGEAALSVIEDMNEMDGPPYTCAEKDGEKIPVVITMPVRFKLESVKID